jgi:hypothetical protein
LKKEREGKRDRRESVGVEKEMLHLKQGDTAFLGIYKASRHCLDIFMAGMSYRG